MKRRVVVRYTAHRIPEINPDIEGSATGLDGPPTLTVTNQADRDLYLHLNGQPEIHVAPHATVSVTEPAGLYAYNGAYPNLPPVFGHKALINGDAYTWSWYIQAGARSPNRTGPLDPALKSQFATLRADVDAKTAEINNLSQLLDLEKAALDTRQNTANSDLQALNALADRVKAEQDSVNTARPTLDRSNDPAAIDAFNRSVETANKDLRNYQDAKAKHDAEVDAYRQARDEYNAAIAAYNAKLAARNDQRRQLDSLVRRINARK